MARTIEQIQQSIIDAKNATPVLSGLTSTSQVAIWRLWTYITAVATWALENILDIAIAQQNIYIKSQKIHSLTWYSDYAKKFQYGSSLPYGAVEYDNSSLTPSQVETQQVVKFAAAVKTPGGIMIKIAGVDGSGNLQPIGGSELVAFSEYMFRISAAGDNLFYTNNVADNLKVVMNIYYDPLVLNSQGKRLDGSNDTPVAEAIDTFIKQMDFNGRLVPQDFVDWLQKVEGVKIVDPVSIETQYGATAWTPVPADGVVPDAGYLRIDNPATDLVINYHIWKP